MRGEQNFASATTISGDSGVDQLVEIIKVLGTPTKEEDKKNMNSNYMEFKFPELKGCQWKKIFRNRYRKMLWTLLQLILPTLHPIRLQPGRMHRSLLNCGKSRQY
jgi:hypothetical protein